MTFKRFMAAVSLCIWLALSAMVVRPGVAQDLGPTLSPKEQPSYSHAMPGDRQGGWENGPRQTPDGLWYMPEGAEQRMDVTVTAPQGTGGPDDFGYTWDDSVPLDWVDASSGNDADSGRIKIGFPFKYYENTYDYLYVSRHGFVAFSDEYLGNVQSRIPNRNKPNDVIAPHWARAFHVGYIRYLRGGISPNRWFAVEWNNLDSDESRYTFEVVLYENGDIAFQYGDMTYQESYLCGASGIEDSTGLDGLAVTGICDKVGGDHAVKFNRPAPDARAGMYLVRRSAFSHSGSTATFHIPIRNTGELGADTFDITLSSSWPATLYHADGMTPLSDTNGNGAVDIGSLDQGQSKGITVKVQAPSDVDIGAYNEVTLTVRSSLNIAMQKTISLRTAVPTKFVQVYEDDADGAMSIDFVGPYTRFRRKASDDRYWARDLAVAELPNQNIIYAWTNSRCINEFEDECDIYASEIEYIILNPTGETVRPITRLSDHSGVTMRTHDYAPALAVAPNGRIGILWYRVRGDEWSGEFNYNIHFATLDSDGDIVSAPQNITDNEGWGRGTISPSMTKPQIAATDENHFILSWRQYTFYPNDDCGSSGSNCKIDDIWYALRRSSGSEKKGPTKLTNDTLGLEESFQNPSLTNTNGLHALLTFTRGSDDDIYFAVIHSQGYVVKGMTNLSQNDGSNDRRSDAVQLSDGRVVVAWSGGNYWQPDMRFAVLDTNYNLVAAPKTLPNPAAVTGDNYVSVTADDSDRAVLTWMDFDHYDRRNLYYALVDGSGSILTPATIFRTSQATDPYIFTSFEGYGNTSYSWRPAGVDASLSVSDATLSAAPGSTVELGIQYANQGSTATGVTLKATLDAHLTYHADSSGVTPIIDSSTVTWYLPDLRMFEEDDFALHLQATGGTPDDLLPIHLELHSNEPDISPDDNVAIAQVKVAKPLASGIDTLNISLSDPDTLDPALAASTTSIQMVNQLFSGLTRLDDTTGQTLPDLASSWEMSLDGKTFTFTLRDGLTWSDGTALTAEHVRYGVLRSLDPAIGSAYAYPLYIIKNADVFNQGSITDPNQVGVTVLDATHIRFELTEPAAYFPGIMSMWVARPMPEWAINAWGDDWTDPDHIVSSGPYLLDERVDNGYILLTKNPDFYNAANAHIEKVNVHIVDDMNDAWDMYQAGELDTAGMPTDKLSEVRSDPILSQQFHTQPRDCTYYYGFSTSQPPFDNPLVRKAFAAAMDRQGLIANVTGGIQQPALTYTPPGIFGHVDGYTEGVGHPFNVAQARKWLSDAGYPNGQGLRPITLWHSTSSANETIADYVVQRWQDVLGVTVERRDMPWGDYFSSINSDEAQIWSLGWCSDYNDAYNFLHDGVSRDRHGSWTNTTYDNLLAQAVITSDPSARKTLYKQAEEILVESDAVMIPIYYYAEGILTRPYLQRTYGSSLAIYLADWRITRVSATIDTDGGSLASYAGDVTIDIPTGTMADAIELIHSPAYGMPAPVGLTGIGQVFEIVATYRDSGQPAQPEPGKSYNIAVQYADSIPALEDTLALYVWDGNQWVLEPTSLLDPSTNTISAMPGHFSTWAVMGEGIPQYLPMLMH
ncbi:MAG: hypothetical protein GY759_24105 [Chloroflexi bacterium]|nr:hypothetical protein [Chloroflexota bacterium]